MDMLDWTSRYLNALIQGPSKREEKTMNHYRDMIQKIRHDLANDRNIEPRQKDRLNTQLHALLGIHKHTEETLASIKGLRDATGVYPQLHVANQLTKHGRNDDDDYDRIATKRIRYKG
jgi:predicted ArsR family transcriptional regulator